jgi:hypothetical protein
MENGSLKEHLQGKSIKIISKILTIVSMLIVNFLIFHKFDQVISFPAAPIKTPLNWRIRIQIAIDVAAALVGLGSANYRGSFYCLNIAM